MSSFTKNGISVVPPIGSIMAYMGTTSPEGWIICDGEPVFNIDGMYDALINIGIGIGSGTSYTPPDLKGRFLYGSNTVSTMGTMGTMGGHDTVTLAEANMPSHTHTIKSTQDPHTHTQEPHNHTQDEHNHTQEEHTHTQDSHNHTLMDLGNADRWYSGGGGNAFGRGTAATSSATPIIQKTTATNQATTATNQATTATNQDTVATNQATTATNQATTATNQETTPAITSTAANTGSGTSFSIIPPYVTVNYILKY